jgi:hypothetical protein
MTVPFFKRIHMFVNTNYDETFLKKNVTGLIAVFYILFTIFLSISPF